MEGHATAAAAGVQHASSYIARRPPFDGFPVPVGSEEIVGGEDRDEAVVAFDDLVRVLTV
jgi:hypothetical protein